MRFFVGLITGAFGVFVVAAIVIATGAIDMSARPGPGALERLVGEALVDRSTAKRAPKVKSPLGATPEVIAAGLRHYRSDCLVCHGAPAVKRGEIGDGLNPPPPDLAEADVQGSSDGELFFFVAKGIRMTGMPAFADGHNERELWEDVAFVRHLPALTDAERAELRSGREPGNEAHSAEGRRE